VLEEGVVKVTSTKVAVIGRGLDGELTLGEGDDRNRVVGMTDVDEADMSRSFGSLGEIALGDSVTESDSGSVVDETKGVESGNTSGIEESTSLDVSVPSGNGNDDVGNGLLELGGGNVTEFAEVGGNELSEGEGRWLAKVVDLLSLVQAIPNYGHCPALNPP
jgi:hypothetical protein